MNGGKGLNGLSAQVLELRDELSRWITYFWVRARDERKIDWPKEKCENKRTD